MFAWCVEVVEVPSLLRISKHVHVERWKIDVAEDADQHAFQGLLHSTLSSLPVQRRVCKCFLSVRLLHVQEQSKASVRTHPNTKPQKVRAVQDGMLVQHIYVTFDRGKMYRIHLASLGFVRVASTRQDCTLSLKFEHESSKHRSIKLTHTFLAKSSEATTRSEWFGLDGATTRALNSWHPCQFGICIGAHTQRNRTGPIFEIEAFHSKLSVKHIPVSNGPLGKSSLA